MKILIIQTAFIGDVILATPLVESIRREYPDSTIHFLLRKGNETLLTAHPYIEKVWVFNKKEQKYINLLRIIRSIRAESYDYVINLQRFFTTGLMTVLSGGKVKIGFDKNPLSFLFTKAVKHSYGNLDGAIRHEVDRNLSLISELVKEKVRRPVLYPSADDYKVVKPGLGYVCIAPASVWLTKQFPVKKWVQLIRLLPEDLTIYLLGAGNDIPLCQTIREECPKRNIEIVAGKLSFLQSAALISAARMNYVNDSAPLHIASAMNAPVAAIFCSTTPEFGFGPLSDTSYILEVDEKLPCRPCGVHGKKECPLGHFKCSDISDERLLQTMKF
ncbi:MAG: glycosyltransferase family 9 protein [Bacteroidales bacterium]|nr:glycosyltransferase family 9 protein [Bacteroidales bacterium]